MTQRLRSGLRLSHVFFALTTTVSLGGTAQAGWEFHESAKNEAKDAGSKAPAGKTKVPTRIQVFGSGRVKPAEAPAAPVEAPAESAPAVATAEDYAEMLKADEERIRAEEAATERDFESVRERARARRTVEAESETASDAVPEKPVRTAVPKGAKTLGAPPSTRPAPAKRAPAPRPAMETEVITPQATPRTATSVPATEGDSSRGDGINPAFPYTHLLPSPFNLPQGEWVIGSTVAYGLLDFLQVSTNVARTFQQHWNFRAKVPLIEYPTFVASAYVDYESYNPHNIDDANPDIRLNRWQPGLVTGYELAPDMAIFLGGNFNFGKDPIPVRTTSGYLKGAQIEVDWSWLYNPSSSRLGDNAISVGTTYDLTYSLFGFGATHHWRTFSLGVHYTIADRARFLPIFGFNAAASF